MRFVFTSNVSPDYFSDPKGGLMNRLLIWRCSAIPREKLDRGYLEYLAKEELSGILNWAIKGATRLLCGEALRQAGGASQLPALLSSGFGGGSSQGQFGQAFNPGGAFHLSY